MASRQRGRCPSKQQTKGQAFQLLQVVTAVKGSYSRWRQFQLFLQVKGRQFQALERRGRTWGRLVEARIPFLEDLEACLVGMDLGACIV